VYRGGRYTFVGTFLQLAVVGSLLDNVEDFLSEGLVGNGPSSGLSVGHIVVKKSDGVGVVAWREVYIAV
jgi:hypothetical protein